MTWSPLEFCTWLPYLNADFSFSVTEHFLTLHLFLFFWCLSGFPAFWVVYHDDSMIVGLLCFESTEYICMQCHITSHSLLLSLLTSLGKLWKQALFSLILAEYSHLGSVQQGLCLCYFPACGALSQISSEVFPLTPSGVYSSMTIVGCLCYGPLPCPCLPSFLNSVLFLLKKCVLPKLKGWNPNPQCDDIRMWGLWEVNWSWGWSPHEWG